MTLLTMGTTTRLYAEQSPGWQRFQTTLTTAGTSAAQQHINNHMTQQHPYQRQYSHVYYQRLAVLGPVVWKRIHSCYSAEKNDENTNITHTTRILELPEDSLCSCVGTLIVERDLKPQPIEDDSVDLLTVTTSQDNCSFYLEDESGRVALNFSAWWTNHNDLTNDKESTNDDYVDTHSLGGSTQNDTPIDLCTGVVIGIVGVVGFDGIMQVQKVCTAATVQTTKNAAVGLSNDGLIDATNRSPHVLLLSGLDCGSPTASSMSRDMLISYIQGAFPHRDSKAASIVHVIIAGGLVHHSSSDATLEESTMVTTNGCRDLDIFCYQIAQQTGIPISIIPGQNDPTTANWPQRPLHASLIPVSTNSSSNTALLSRCPNPYAATFNLDEVEHQPKRYIFGTDGTNVADWMLQSKRNRPTNTKGGAESSIDELQALHATLAHQHICPTGPDTVPTAPHIEIDPMVMSMCSGNNENNTDVTAVSKCPTLYFAGNCSQFQTKLVTLNVPTGLTTSDDTTTNETFCRLVCIPKFSETSIAVLVNLNTMQIELLKFDSSTPE